MTVSEQNFQIYQGSDFYSDVYQIVDENNVPLDLTDATFSSQTRPAPGTTPVFTLNIEKYAATQGKWRLAVVNPTMSTGQWGYDVFITIGTERYMIMRGTIFVNSRYTEI